MAPNPSPVRERTARIDGRTFHSLTFQDQLVGGG